MRQLILLAAALALFSIAPAFADQHNRPCKADVEKFCKDVKPGGGGIVKCLKDHEAELSPECKAKGEQMKTAIKEAKDACEADVQKFCKDVKKGGGRIIKCLKKHETELSEECKAHGHRPGKH